MLIFEKVLKVFQAYLEDDPLYEVVQTSHGYTLIALIKFPLSIWNQLPDKWKSAASAPTRAK